MSEGRHAGVEPLKCPDCRWEVLQNFPSPDEAQFNRDALAGHRLREHPSDPEPSRIDAVMSVECPFKEEAMRAAFYVGWLAGMR